MAARRQDRRAPPLAAGSSLPLLPSGSHGVHEAPSPSRTLRSCLSAAPSLRRVREAIGKVQAARGGAGTRNRPRIHHRARCCRRTGIPGSRTRDGAPARHRAFRRHHGLHRARREARGPRREARGRLRRRGVRRSAACIIDLLAASFRVRSHDRGGQRTRRTGITRSTARDRVYRKHPGEGMTGLTATKPASRWLDAGVVSRVDD